VNIEIHCHRCQWFNQCMTIVTVVSLNGRDSKAFGVRFGVLQGSMLSPLLFVMVL